MARPKLGNYQRRVSCEILHFLGITQVSTNHELHRIAHTDESGLTDKERKFLKKRLAIMQECQEDISRLRQRLQVNG